MREQDQNMHNSMSNHEDSAKFTDENKKKILFALLKNSIIMRVYDVTWEVSVVFIQDLLKY